MDCERWERRDHGRCGFANATGHRSLQNSSTASASLSDSSVLNRCSFTAYPDCDGERRARLEDGHRRTENAHGTDGDLVGPSILGNGAFAHVVYSSPRSETSECHHMFTVSVCEIDRLWMLENSQGLQRV